MAEGAIILNKAKRFLVLGSSCFVAWNLVSAVAEAQPYVVYVPGNDPQTLTSVRTIAPTAFRASIQGQPSIQAGAFNSSANADVLVQALQQAGFQARKYYRGDGADYTSYTPIPAPPTTTTTPPVSTIPPAPTPIDITSSQYGYTGASPYVSSAVSIPYTIPNGNLVNGGQVPQYRYVAAVPAGGGDLNAKLQQVRQYIPGAFVANSRRGSYIYAGVYPSREGAEALSYYLRSQGLDARVLYF